MTRLSGKGRSRWYIANQDKRQGYSPNKQQIQPRKNKGNPDSPLVRRTVYPDLICPAVAKGKEKEKRKRYGLIMNVVLINVDFSFTTDCQILPS